jgi:hypothetical protein
MHPLVQAAAVTVACSLVPAAFAQTIDGSITQAEYGTPVAVQDTPTGFGDNQNELNAAFADYVSGTGLYLGLTGNLQMGGNGLVLFVDSKPGGAIASTDTDGFGTFGSVGGARTDDFGTDTVGGPDAQEPPNTPSILDAGFNPDYSVEINGFDGTYFVNIIDLSLPNDGDPDLDRFLGQVDENAPAVTQTYTLDDGTQVGDITYAFDNTNTAGVFGFDFDNPPGDLGDPLSATTGFEALLSDEFLMTSLNTSGDIKLLPFITNNDGGFLSNQFLPGLGGVTNLGGPGGDGGLPLFDASVFAGDQFISISLGDTRIPGDANGDGVVNLSDFLILRRNFGNDDAGFADGDFNGDGVVNLSDFLILRRNFGTGGGAPDAGPLDDFFSSVVPEPATAGLLAVGGLALLRRRRS